MIDHTQVNLPRLFPFNPSHACLAIGADPGLCSSKPADSYAFESQMGKRLDATAALAGPESILFSFLSRPTDIDAAARNPNLSGADLLAIARADPRTLLPVKVMQTTRMIAAHALSYLFQPSQWNCFMPITATDGAPVTINPACFPERLGLPKDEVPAPLCSVHTVDRCSIANLFPSIEALMHAEVAAVLEAASPLEPHEGAGAAALAAAVSQRNEEELPMKPIPAADESKGESRFRARHRRHTRGQGEAGVLAP